MIHKQCLELKDTQTITIPWHANIISVAKQKIGGTLETLCVWYYFGKDPCAATKEIEILIVGTGNEGPDVSGGRFLGTFVMENNLVWHVFESPSKTQLEVIAHKDQIDYYVDSNGRRKRKDTTEYGVHLYNENRKG